MCCNYLYTFVFMYCIHVIIHVSATFAFMNAVKPIWARYLRSCDKRELSVIRSTLYLVSFIWAEEPLRDVEWDCLLTGSAAYWWDRIKAGSKGVEESEQRLCVQPVCWYPVLRVFLLIENTSLTGVLHAPLSSSKVAANDGCVRQHLFNLSGIVLHR